MQKNDIFEIDITSITEDGDGIGRIPGDGRVVFCKGALAGEKISAQIIKVTKDYAVAKVNEIIEKSPDRITPDCAYAGKCGGCSFRHCDYKAQLRTKEQYVRDCIKRIGGFNEDDNIDFLPVIGMDNPYNYRNKAIFPFSTDRDGKIISGFYRKNSHSVIEIDSCKIENPMASKIRLAVTEFAVKNNLSAYNEETGKGLIRNLMVRTSHSQNEAMAVLVINADKLPHADNFVSFITEKCPFVSSIFVNVNTSSGNKVSGDKYVHLYGKEKLCDSILNTWFDISPMSFYQVNPEQTEKLYSAVRDFANINGGENVLDIYCGIGTIGLCIANSAQSAGTPLKSLIGIEYIKQAVIDAEHNAALNGITNANFYDGDAGKVLADLSESGKLADNYDVVILDPPRKGCDKKLLDTAVSVNPDRIVYVSCNAATLARDLKMLRELGYEPKKVQPVDMFPFAGHVETVVCLSREKADDCAEKQKMISEERSKYKSWSNLKKQMNDLLCDSLKGKISYFYTSYHEVHNAYGRATINYEKKELVVFSWVEMYKQEQEVSQLYSEGKKVSYGEMKTKKWMPECKLCDADFINSLTIYLKTDIATALHSENYLLRVFAYMDRRVGKRTLVKIKDEVEKLPEWVKQFYRLRCEADGIVFPPKRITDETVCLLTSCNRNYQNW